MGNKSKRALGRPRNSEQHQPTNEIILDAATALFLANGYKEVSVDDIAKKCNVTKATIYYYYTTKSDLFTDAMIQMMYRIRGYMQSMLIEDKPLPSRLLKVAKAHLQATVDIDLDSFMRETRNVLSKEQIKRMHAAEYYMHQVIEEAFIAAVQTGEISEVDPKFATHAYISLMKVGNYKNPDNTTIFPTIEETAEQLVTFFWNGLFQKQQLDFD